MKENFWKHASCPFSLIFLYFIKMQLFYTPPAFCSTDHIIINPEFIKNGTNKDEITIILKRPSAFMHHRCMVSAAKGKWFKHRAWRLNFDHFHKNDDCQQKALLYAVTWVKAGSIFWCFAYIKFSNYYSICAVNNQHIPLLKMVFQHLTQLRTVPPAPQVWFVVHHQTYVTPV